jgi:hypothetical protein
VSLPVHALLGYQQAVILKELVQYMLSDAVQLTLPYWTFAALPAKARGPPLSSQWLCTRCCMILQSPYLRAWLEGTVRSLPVGSTVRGPPPARLACKVEKRTLQHGWQSLLAAGEP